MEGLVRDMRAAIRTLAKARGFTAVVVLLLAIGIGATTAVFSVVDAVILRPLPYRDADRLMVVRASLPTSDQPVPMPAQGSHFLRDHARSFEDLAGMGHTWFTVLEGDTAELEPGAPVTAEFFRVCDGQPWLGRTFAPGDTEDDHLVVLSYRLWEKGFGANPGIVGELINLNTKPYRVIGVMPRDYLNEFWHELWVLSDFRPADEDQRGRWLQLIGRLKPGVTVTAADREIAALGAQAAEPGASAEATRRYGVTPLQASVVKDARRDALMMTAAIVIVLVIACANVANLFLARASARRAEIGIRLSLGAAPAHIVRQLMTEGALLALAGGALGLVLAAFAVDALVTGFARLIPHAGRAGLDLRALGFAVSASLGTTLLFALAPALEASRWDVHEILKESGPRATASKRATAMRSALVASEIALAVVLVAGAGVLARSLARLASVDRGFDTRGVVIFGLSLPAERYPTPERRASFFEAALSKVKALPGVQAAGATRNLPTIGGSTDLLQIEGRPPLPRSGLTIRPSGVTPDYARAIGMRVRAGRFVEESDVLGSTPVIVVNKAMADRFFPGESPVGRRIRVDWDESPGAEEVWYAIVGVVEDMRSESLRSSPMFETFVPLAQHPSSGAQFAVRVSIPVSSAYPQLQRAFRDVDLFVPIHQIQIGKDLNGTLEAFVTREIEPLRFAAGLAAVLGLTGLLLAAIGVFGVVSYSVEQRRHEFAVRLALGATPRDVLGLVLRQTAPLVAVGVAVGLGAALALVRLLGALVFGVSPLDPASLVVAALVLLATALLASYLPARRATRTSPMLALRAD